ncbi:MAG: tetratricopeptide repeat protein [Candidatus Thiodiazotropha sp.]
MSPFWKGFFESNSHSQEEKVQKLLSEAQSFGRQNDYDAALRVVNKVIEIDDQCAEAYNLRGATLSAMEKWNLAIPEYNNAIEIDPKDWQHYAGRCNAYVQLRALDLALKDVDKALELDNQNTFLYMTKGIIYLNAHNRKLANIQAAACLAIDQYDESSGQLNAEVSKLSKNTVNLLNSIHESKGIYEDEAGEYARSGGQYLAGYWGVNQEQFGYLWTTKVDEALEVSPRTVMRFVMSDSNLQWEGVAVNKADDIQPA